MDADLGALLAFGGALLAGGAAYGGVKQAVSALSRQLGRHIEADEVHQRDAIGRLARIETLLEKR